MVDRTESPVLSKDQKTDIREETRMIRLHLIRTDYLDISAHEIVGPLIEAKTKKLLSTGSSEVSA
jgi:hypothetical protein